VILAILQARMSSTRLPGKVMRDLAGAPMIERQIERLRRASSLDRLVVATSDRPDDDGLAEHAAALGMGVHRGSLPDVLARFAGALEAFGPARHVVRFTADCPLIDPAVVDRLVAAHGESGADYSTNGGEGRAYPVGLDCEIMTAAALREAAHEAVDPYEREHVTPFIYRRPERYALHRLPGPPDQGELRWTVDTADDLAFARAVFAGLHARNPDFRAADVLAFVRSRPDLMTLGGERRG
jgi:spore coat polysaccharide biosynthesis protein SpsF